MLKALSLGIIPARGGSKSIPLKNIQPLHGKPLIQYTIDVGKKSRLLNRLIVSTDHPRIAKISTDYGAEVIMRPAEFATDEAPTELALIHVIETLKQKEGYQPEFVVTLEPTSPFRTADLVDRCIEKAMATPEADCVLTVVETRKCYGQLEGERFEYLFKNHPRRRQDRKPLYEEIGTVYVTRTTSLLKHRTILGHIRYVVIVDNPEEAVDINEPIDGLLAEAILKKRTLGGNL